ncbi:hypothetical protein G6F40_017528 [Rhizopus arrhizus]|nr:hypothetical protein G6F40_017528 [Rhizopus arrhizus]
MDQCEEKERNMRRDFLKTVAAAGASLAGANAFALSAPAAPGTGLKGAASDVYVMNVMVSGVEYWFPVYEMMNQLGHTLGVKTRSWPASPPASCCTR